jgi:hypothetical protein
MAIWDLDLQDYLDSTGEAAKRTRLVTVVLVIATLLVFASVLDSQQTNWMHARLVHLRSINDDYTALKLGARPTGTDSADIQERIYEDNYRGMWDAVYKTYVDNAWVVKVPFFGFTFDINDMGFVAGVGFIIILACLLFCLTREVDNLQLAFSQARKVSKLAEFYQLVAMRQVFTVPESGQGTPSKVLTYSPKLIPWFSLLVYSSVAINDFRSRAVGRMLSNERYFLLVGFEVISLLLIMTLAYHASAALRRLDTIWDRTWKEIIASAKHVPGAGVTPPLEEEDALSRVQTRVPAG